MTASAWRDAVAAFGRAVDRESHVLVDEPELLFQQVHNRVQWEAGVDQDALERARGQGTPWLRTHDPLRESDELVHTCLGHGGSVEAVAFSPDSTWVVSASDDGTLRVWDTASGGVLMALAGHDGPVWACAANVDGALVASAGRDGTVRLWDPHAGGEVLRIDAHQPTALACAFSPDGSVLASAGGGGVHLWDVSTGGRLASLALDDGRAVAALAFTPDGRSLVLEAGPSLVLWALRSGERRLLRSEGHVRRCAVDPGGAFAVTAGISDLRVWDLRSGSSRQLATEGSASCAVSPDGELVLEAGGALRVWDPARGVEVHRLVGHEGPVRACAMSPDGRWIATGGADRTVRIWDGTRLSARGEPLPVESSELARSAVNPIAAWAVFDAEEPDVLAPPSGEAGSVVSGWGSCAVGPGRSVAVTWRTGAAAVWDPTTGRTVGRISSSSDVGVAALAPDGSWLLGSVGSRLEAWDLATRTSVGAFVTGTDPVSGEAFSHHGAGITGCCISPDGTWAASVDAGGTLCLWDPATGQALEVAHGLRGHVCAPGPDGSFVVAGGDDGRLVVATPGGSSLDVAIAAHPGGVLSCAVTPDGAMLVSSGADRAVRVWHRWTGVLLASAHLPRVRQVVVHPWKPWVACASALGPVFIELVGLELGPLRLVAQGDDARVRCPACGTDQSAGAGALGAERSCSGCGRALRVGPRAMRVGPPTGLRDTTDDDVRRTYYDDW